MQTKIDYKMPPAVFSRNIDDLFGLFFVWFFFLLFVLLLFEYNIKPGRINKENRHRVTCERGR